MNVTTASSTLTQSALTSFTELTSDTGGLEMGEKAGIGIGVSIAVLVLGTGAYFLRKRASQKSSAHPKPGGLDSEGATFAGEEQGSHWRRFL